MGAPARRRALAILGGGLLALLASGPAREAAEDPGEGSAPCRYILFNRAPGIDWRQDRPDSLGPDDFAAVREPFAAAEAAAAKREDAASDRLRVGLGFVFSPLAARDGAELRPALRRVLELAERTDTPVFVQLDVENWWGGHPELWNWWDPSRPGYDPADRRNVEWTGWSPDRAVKIAWRNWGRQIRVLPPPNLMSPAYRALWHREVDRLAPIVARWWRALPPERRDLLAGVKVGHESSIGVNAFHYPGGNALLDRPPRDDPTGGIRVDEIPSRGVATLGYAAVRTAGLACSGELREEHVAEVVRRHLEDLSRRVAEAGIPRDRLFTHSGGWSRGERLYDAALNRWASPGWSFYRHAGDPRRDAGVRRALAASDAPVWGAVEWLYQGPRETASWQRALERTLSFGRCRLVCLYNWEGVRSSPEILAAVRAVLGAPPATRGGDCGRSSRPGESSSRPARPVETVPETP